MLPSFIAYKRNHKNTIAVILINFFLGATVIGWVGALIWAVLDKQSDDDEETSENMVLNGADAIIKYKNLLDQGVITKEEFEVKKKQLLDL
ncbi:MAG: superinfection immunity protein [Oscillospiraceae bacterium]|nr:superinfection immunity protein [Oscillospiraceae bacterium]